MRAIGIGLALALAGCSGGYSLVRPGEARVVAGSVLTVSPATAWNRLGRAAGPGRHAELWTLDGPALNELVFYAVPDGAPLFREVDRRDRPLPRFASSMLPTDVAALFESSYRVASGSALVTIGSIAPARFAGRQGFRFDYRYSVQGEEVARRGEATGAIVGGMLYLAAFEAPAIHYFDRDVAAARAVVAGAALTASRGR